MSTQPGISRKASAALASQRQMPALRHRPCGRGLYTSFTILVNEPSFSSAQRFLSRGRMSHISANGCSLSLALSACHLLLDCTLWHLCHNLFHSSKCTPFVPYLSVHLSDLHNSDHEEYCADDFHQVEQNAMRGVWHQTASFPHL